MKQYFPKNNIKEWGCCAGNFLKTSSFIYCYENSISFLNDKYDYITKNIFNKLGWCDVLFNLIFGMFNLNYINNTDYSESNSTFPIFHDKISPRIRNN